MRFALKSAVLLLCVPGVGLAFNNFQNPAQSASALGVVGAGVAASTTDPDVAFYNPASMSYFKGQDASFSLIGLADSSHFKGSMTPSPAVSNFNTSGTAQGGYFEPLYAIMYVAPINNKWAFGVSISQPYSLSLDYGSGGVTRYASTTENFYMMNFGPSLSYKPTKSLSFGLGFDVAYAAMRFDKMNFSGTTSNDSKRKLYSNDWGYGYHLGMLWKASSKTVLGLSYRSRMAINFRGNDRVTGPLGYTRTRFKSDLTLPPVALLSLQQQLADRWALLGSVAFTQYSDMDKWVLQDRASSEHIDVVKKLNDSWRYALATKFTLNPVLNVTAGVAYTTSGLADSDRFATFPMSSQTTLGFGVNYRINDEFGLSFAYNHDFINSGRINQYLQSDGSTSVTGNGRVRSNQDSLGLELDWKMT
jgi:long-chain fatty acid transport protein